MNDTTINYEYSYERDLNSDIASNLDSDDDIVQFDRDNALLYKQLVVCNKHYVQDHEDETSFYEEDPLRDFFSDCIFIPSHEIAPTISNVLKINAAMLKALNTLLAELKARKEENEEEQENIMRKMARLSLKNVPDVYPSLKRCAAPFIKAPNGVGPPRNVDVVSKLSKGQLLPEMFFAQPYVWSKSECDDVRQLVYRKASYLQMDLENIDVEKIDWMQIAAELNSNFSCDECKQKWITSLDPRINRKPWRVTEFARLGRIVEQNAYQGWERIAKELGTNRSALQCCVHFQRHARRNGPEWTQKENATLLMLVEKYRIDWYIHWPCVCYFLITRSLRQAIAHYDVLRTTRTRGRFTDAETSTLRQTYRGNMSLVQELLPHRTSKQLRARLEYVTRFTPAEDEKLLRALMRRGQWIDVQHTLPGFLLHELQARWFRLQNEARSKGLSENFSENIKTAAKLVLEARMHDSTAKRAALRKHYASRPHEVKLLKYLAQGYGYLFGPHFFITKNNENVVTRLSLIFSSLSITTPLPTIAAHLQSSKFETDTSLLRMMTTIKDEPIEPVSPHPLIINQWIPPNYHTMLGLYTLLNTNYSIYENICDTTPTSHFNESIPVERRILVSDAEKLFRTRFFNIFFLSVIMCKIGKDDTPSLQLSSKPRVHKYVPKAGRKNHCKKMAAIRWKKEKLDEIQRRKEILQAKVEKQTQLAVAAVKAKRNRGRPRKNVEAQASSTVPQKKAKMIYVEAKGDSSSSQLKRKKNSGGNNSRKKVPKTD